MYEVGPYIKRITSVHIIIIYNQLALIIILMIRAYILSIPLVCLTIIPRARIEYDTVAKRRVSLTNVKYSKGFFKIAAQRISINVSEIMFLKRTVKKQGTFASVTCHQDFPHAQFRDNSGLNFICRPITP